jgi:hypothetical protein
MGVRTSVLLIGYTVRWLFHQASSMVLAEALHKHRLGPRLGDGAAGGEAWKAKKSKVRWARDGLASSAAGVLGLRCGSLEF